MYDIHNIYMYSIYYNTLNCMFEDILNSFQSQSQRQGFLFDALLNRQYVNHVLIPLLFIFEIRLKTFFASFEEKNVLDL